MKMTGNTILITGGGSGIGRALAKAFHRSGNHVVIAGRRQHALDEVTAANPGMKALTVDMADHDSIRSFAAALTDAHPALNVLINNAGIMRTEHLPDDQGDLTDAEAVVTTNLLGPIRLTAALLPSLRGRPAATVMNVSSGLAFVPLATTPTYCATKAALHSYTQSLRYQLRATPVEVLELIPPYVQTELSGAHQLNDSRAMPLADFIDEVMSLLATRPDATEICVNNVLPLRLAAGDATANYDKVFEGMNAAMASNAKTDR